MRFLLYLALAIPTTLGACHGASVEGGSCDSSKDCRGDLTCVRGTCQIKEGLQREMARQSGVSLSGEEPAGIAGPNSVRHRSAKGDEYAFAVCGNDERLISGWCDPVAVGTDNTEAVHQELLGSTENDTVGARWVCSFRNSEVTAHALCQKLP